jgi:hypothetical protein
MMVAVVVAVAEAPVLSETVRRIVYVPAFVKV